MPRPRLTVRLPLCLVAVLVGCGTGAAPRPANTVAGNVAADTARARADTDAAFDRIARGDDDGARPLLEHAVDADALYGPAHNDLGLVDFHQGRPYDAAREFERAAHLMPRRGEPLNNLGLVYESADEWPEAEGAYRSALDLDPASAEFAGNLARVRIRRGERDEVTRQLLELVILRDARPAWVQWARANVHRTSATTAP